MSSTPEMITSLIADLCGPNEFRRTQASFALGVLGEPAVGPLTELLKSPDSETRKRAAWVLGVVGAPALPHLLQLAEGDDEHMRIEAIRVLGVVGEARALNQLFIGLADPNPRVAARAARAIGKIGDTRAYHALITALHHPQADVRFEACRALVDLRILEAIPALQELVTLEDMRTSWGSSVAEAAARAAAELTSSANEPIRDSDFERASKLLREQQHLTGEDV